jgi:hypothetical protein
MDFQNQYEFALPIAEMPDDQPPAPGTDAPGVDTGSRIDADEQAERKDEDEVGEIESQNP